MSQDLLFYFSFSFLSVLRSGSRHSLFSLLITCLLNFFFVRVIFRVFSSSSFLLCSFSCRSQYCLRFFFCTTFFLSFLSILFPHCTFTILSLISTSISPTFFLIVFLPRVFLSDTLFSGNLILFNFVYHFFSLLIGFFFFLFTFPLS